MKYLVFALVFTSTLAACGGGGGNDRPARMAPVASFAKGPIGDACVKSRRQAASRSMCGCVQAAADLTLSGRDQRRGAKFFTDLKAIQDMQLSDTPANEAFWDRWQNFSDTAESMCRSA